MRPVHSRQRRQTVKLLVLLEGNNDIEFFRGLSTVLHADDQSIPNLIDLEESGSLIFIPIGGGNIARWSARLSPLNIQEFHIYDQEVVPESERRQHIVQDINRRKGCFATLTQKRSLENYLHPFAIKEAGEIEVSLDDVCPVADLVAQQFYGKGSHDVSWEELSRRAQRRLINHAKRWLNTTAVNYMTLDLLNQRDPEGDFISWFSLIYRLASM